MDELYGVCCRFLAIWWPLKCQITKRRARVIVVVIWVLALTTTIPWALFFELVAVYDDAPDIRMCIEVWPEPLNGTLYFLIANLLCCYLLPFAFISLCYVLIWVKVRLLRDFWLYVISQSVTLSHLEKYKTAKHLGDQSWKGEFRRRNVNVKLVNDERVFQRYATIFTENLAPGGRNRLSVRWQEMARRSSKLSGDMAAIKIRRVRETLYYRCVLMNILLV